MLKVVTDLRFFIAAEDGKELLKLPKVKLIRNDKREGTKLQYCV